MIQVVSRVFTILEELNLDGEVSLTSLARITSLNKGTLCNILRTLIELGYVSRTRGSHYSLTPRFRELAKGDAIEPDEMGIFRKNVESLAASTGESGVLATMRGNRIAVVAQAQHQRTLMVNTFEIYAALSLFHSVSGRILVSYLKPQERAALCASAGLPGEEWDGIETLEELENACAANRKAGILIMENPTLEIISFAVPVFRPDGKVLSLGLTMPLMRCSAAERKRIVALLKSHAEELSVPPSAVV